MYKSHSTVTVEDQKASGGVLNDLSYFFSLKDVREFLFLIAFSFLEMYRALMSLWVKQNSMFELKEIILKNLLHKRKKIEQMNENNQHKQNILINIFCRP